MIILFDIDGVLIHNRAYHAALQKTVTYFGQRLGVGDVTLTADDIAVYESQSITVEWDSSAMSVALLLLERLKAKPLETGALLGDIWAVIDALATEPLPIARPNFSAVAQHIGQATPPGRLPSHTALELFSLEMPSASGLFRQLLDDCYDIDVAPAMQIFQNYALGHRQYEHYYGLPRHFESEALLEELDRPALRPDWAERILALRAEGQVYPVIYTARPSLAPREVSDHQRGYTPEAEIARDMVGLQPIPVTAYGKMDWMARRVGLAGRDLIKPSPVQAMAAIAAARTGLEVESLKAALAVMRGDHLRYPLTACAGQAVHVFEDSPSSLRAATRAVELLNRQGLNLTLTRHGIASKASPKHAALSAIADVVHEDVNDGLEEVLREA